jgi:hypothetical protein
LFIEELVGGVHYFIRYLLSSWLCHKAKFKKLDKLV